MNCFVKRVHSAAARSAQISISFLSDGVVEMFCMAHLRNEDCLY